MLELDGRIYFCGYPNAILGSFGEDGVSLLGDWHASLRSKYSLFLLRGADGRIYSGNHNERESTGGGLGWYDPVSGEFDGIHFPNDDCEFLTTALDSRLIVYASDFSVDPSQPQVKHRRGKLICYDTATRRVVRELSPLDSGSAGVVLETERGVLFGIGRHDKLPVMYRVDIATGVVRREPLPARAPRQIARGPAGRIYVFLGGSLVRANARTFAIETLCPAEPGRMVFLGDDLYLGGTSQLRRVIGVAGKP